MNNKHLEHCWILLGEWHDDLLFWGRMRRMTVGSPAEVAFAHAWVLRREEERGDVIGWLHTHPGMPARPSTTDHDTMHAWVCAFGKSLVCAIEGVDGLKAYCYDDDENPPVECVVKRLGSLVFGTIDEEKDDVPRVDLAKMTLDECVQADKEISGEDDGHEQVSPRGNLQGQRPGGEAVQVQADGAGCRGTR